MRNRKTHFFCIISELGAGARGTSLGPDALQIQASKVGSKVFFDKPLTEYYPGHQPLYQPTDTPNAKHIDVIQKRWHHIADTVSGILSDKSFPVVLSGDHSSAGAVIAGIKQKHPNKRLGVVWVDAHLDLHSPYTTPSGNVHGMPLGASLGLTTTDKNKNALSKKEAKRWEEMISMGGIRPKIKPEDIIFHGIRSYERPEWELVQDLGINYFTVEDLREQGAETVAKATLDQLSDCDIIFISFDVDSLDAKIAPGTGTPEPNGYTAKEAQDLLIALKQTDKLVAFEVTELNPLLESPNTTEVVFDIFENVINA